MPKYQKKRNYRRRRNVRRKTKYSMAKSVNLRSDVHYFRRMSYKGNFIGNSTTVFNTGLSFALSDLPSSSDFINLFDQYKILSITLKFTLGYDPSALSSNQTYPRMWSIVDYDDNNSPGDAQELRQRAKTKYTVLSPNKTHVFKFKPATLTNAYNNLVGVGYKPSWGDWIDVGNPSLPYFGFKFALELFYSGQFLTCETVYDLAFKNTI